MKRIAFFAYGVSAHLLFLAVYAWLAGFVGNLFVPHSMDSAASDPVPLALAIDVGLIALFGLQHSIMARPAFKRVWTRIVPEPIERSTYVFASNAATMLLIWQWRPVDLVIWDVQSPIARGVIHGLFAVGFLLVPGVTLLINHFDLFGTRQVWLYLRGREYTSLPFRTPLLYARVRHPLYIGWAIFFWATPTMTAGHLLVAAGMTAYMLLAVLFEERDLVAHFGRQYEEYQHRVPMFLPWRGTARPAPAFDSRVFSDPGWLHWAITAPLLAAYLAGVSWALPVAMALCAAMAGFYFARLRTVKPIPVQLRLFYLVMLAAGTVPGLQWVHWFQLVGTTVMVTTGYCLLARLLSLFWFNRTERLSRSLIKQILLSPVTQGGLLRWPARPELLPAGQGSLRASSCTTEPAVRLLPQNGSRPNACSLLSSESSSSRV